MFLAKKTNLCWTLAVVMALSPSLVHAQSPEATNESPRKPDVSYVSPEAAFGAMAFPRRVLTSPEAWMLPVEVISAAGKKELGIDPLDVEQIMVLAEPPTAMGPPNVGIVVHFSRAYQLDNILPKLQPMTQEGQIEGKPYRQAMGPMAPSLFMPDDHTLIVATEAMLQKMVTNHSKPAKGRMSSLLARLGTTSDFVAILMVEPIRPMVSGQLEMMPVPPPFEDVKKLPELIDLVGVKANLVGKMGGLLSITARDETAAMELEKMIDGWLTMAHQMMEKEMAKEMAEKANNDDPVEQATAKYTQRVSKRMLEMLRPERKGNRLVLSTGNSNSQAQMATIGILVALLLPAIQAAREAARRAKSINNMRMLGIALHNYHDAHHKFPARAIFNKQGKPLLSWRVELLPYLDQQALYNQFHLDEPWDSPHNKPLSETVIDVFHNPSSTAPLNTTTYLAPVGKGLFFDGKKGRSIRDIRDGSSNTIMLVEANDDQAVPWAKPDDWQFNAQKPMVGLGSAHPGFFHVLFGDGSARLVEAGIDQELFKKLLTINGGEAVNEFFEQ